MLIYVAGPYRGDVDRNIAKARAVAAQCYLAGHTVICPHLNSAKMDVETGLPDEFWLDATLKLLERCDAIVLVEGWRESQGTLSEVAYAKIQGIPIYTRAPELHTTEVRCPEQCRGFMEILMRMYRLHLSKNADYSPANILATGDVGVVVRLWDKVARLMNLTGFVIKVEKGAFVALKEPKHESIEDTLIDTAITPSLLNFCGLASGGNNA
jgi:hypothetical protein